jgi:hypothetical protein
VNKTNASTLSKKDRLKVSVASVIPFLLSFSIPAHEIAYKFNYPYLTDVTITNLPSFLLMLTVMSLIWLVTYSLFIKVLSKANEVLKLLISSLLFYFLIIGLWVLVGIEIERIWPPWVMLFGLKSLVGYCVGLVLGVLTMTRVTRRSSKDAASCAA